MIEYINRKAIVSMINDLREYAEENYIKKDELLALKESISEINKEMEKLLDILNSIKEREVEEERVVELDVVYDCDIQPIFECFDPDLIEFEEEIDCEHWLTNDVEAICNECGEECNCDTDGDIVIFDDLDGIDI